MVGTVHPSLLPRYQPILKAGHATEIAGNAKKSDFVPISRRLPAVGLTILFVINADADNVERQHDTLLK
jgi:hypothetical protein